VLMLAVFALGVIAGATGRMGGGIAAAVAALVIIAGATLRVVRMVMRDGRAHPLTIIQALVVSCVYDLARAVALVTRTPHRTAPPTRTVPAQ